MASLGCAKNLVDAETMLGETLDDEFHLALDPAAADVIIINTCGFIEDARQEAREVIEEYLELKRTMRGRLKVVATGCWADRSPADLLTEFPDLDGVWGLAIPSSLRESIRGLGLSDSVAGIGVPAHPREGARLVTTLPSFAYLRLSDGCDNRCHYCAIPLIRGGLRSRDPEAVLEEARSLEQQGARELVVISQDTTAYGMDLGRSDAALAPLLERLLSEVSLPRIRVLYAHPAHIDDRVIDMLRNEQRLCGYLDLPIQHASDNVLSRMGRGYGRDRILEILERLGGGVTLRTTILAGFPGETEQDFLQTLELVERGAFRHLGAFAYSPETGTPACDFPDQVPPETARERRDALMEAQSRVAFGWLDSRLGKKERVLVDARLDREWVLARSRHEAPDADGRIYLRNAETRPGAIIEACIQSREGYDLVADTGAAKGRKRRRGR